MAHPSPFEDYRVRYLKEMELHKAQISDLAGRVRNGETITLLCATACTDPDPVPSAVAEAPCRIGATRAVAHIGRNAPDGDRQLQPWVS